jgi:hypothetical protein
MAGRKDQAFEGRALDLLDRHWKLIVVLVWLGLCAWFYYTKMADIRLFALADTDDNLRMAQVRGLLKGQDWYDLRQYRLNPPEGANIHWSRFVDLPLAGLILTLRPFVGGPAAERLAVAIAPMLPYLLVLFSLALTVRRLIDPRAYVLAFVALFFAASTNGMFAPLRIDHHGWQLAILALGVSGLADPNRSRGGLVLGVATAWSLAIGLEMLIYLAIAAVATVLFWVRDAQERDRMRTYAVALGGGTSVAFLLFASNDNWNAVCDALSPVWLADALLGGALLFGLTMLSPPDWKRRLALALAAGVIIAVFHTVSAPHCVQRLEGVSPEVERLWLSHVREAKPLYGHGWRIALMVATLPITGAIGWAILIWARRHDHALLPRAIAAAAPAIVATLLLLWQTRTGPAAQMLGTIGAAALLWFVVPRLWNAGSAFVRVLGVAALVVIGAGAAVPLGLNLVPAEPPTKRSQAIGRANRLCNSLPGLRPIALQPKGIVFTFVDLGPRLIASTHHSSIIGPYHRNGEQIADVMNAFRGDAQQARRLIAKYRSDYLLICPNASTTTIFASEAPNGFYTQLSKGQVPSWLTPVPLPRDSPFKMWRVAP